MDGEAADGAAGDGEADGDADALGLADELGLVDALGLAEPLGLVDGLALGPCEGDGLVLAGTVADGTGDGVGIGVRNPPWPKSAAYRKISTNVATTTTTQTLVTGSSMYGSCSDA
jgi:hypothetical protein